MMILTSLLTIFAAMRGSLAYTVRNRKFDEVLLQEGQVSNNQPEMIGDLATLPVIKLTATGRSIKAILQGRESPMDVSSIYPSVPDQDSDACEADTCCIWKFIADEMYQKFHGDSGRCTKYARAAVRLGFHDAASWSKSTGTSGGADGSILLANELTRSEHNGLQDIGIVVQGWYDKYHWDYSVSMADLIQIGAKVAAVTCPLGPRVRSFVGRKDSSHPAPSGLMPDPNDPPEKLIALFRNKTITPDGLIALVGAHTTSQQHFVQPSRDGAPQDSTPGVWDVRFYSETKGRAPPRVFKIPSDVALSKDTQTGDTWDAFAERSGQVPWNIAYAREYVRMSLLGVYNINDLTECTKVLPMPVNSYTPPDQAAVQQWLNGKDPPPGLDVGAILEGGGILSLVGGVLGVLGEILGGGDEQGSGEEGQGGLGEVIGEIGGVIGGIGGVIGGLLGGG